MPFLFIIFLIYIFYISRRITQLIYSSVILLTGNNKMAIAVLALILLPGTIIHELSHFVFATVLRVPTGKITVIPKIGEGGEIKTGQMEMAKTDPFRYSIIGMAPLISGLIIIYFTGKLFLQDNNFIKLISNFQLPTSYITLYLFFIISNTMFTSRKDLEGLKIAGPIAILFLITLYITGVRIFFDKNFIEKINTFISDLNIYLLISAITNLAVFILLELYILFWQKILRRKILQ
jgi:hypothetical protein